MAGAKLEATRTALGETLVELVSEGVDVVTVEADLGASTTTSKFGRVYPCRFFDVGIAEQNMLDVAAGLALAGKVAFTGSFAVFGTGRAYDQIRNTVCYSKLNVKISPTHAGVSVGPDGGSHQMLEDISLMRGLPNMRVLVPADYYAAKAAIRLAALTPGPMYVRLGRAKVPCIYREGFSLMLGSASVLREGGDVTIAACGIEVDQALKAAEALAMRGVSAEVIDVPSIKPLGAETLLSSVRKTGCLVTAEEHSIIGGLGSACAELLAENLPAPMRRIGVHDEFGTSGGLNELLDLYALDASAICEAAVDVIACR